MSLIRPASEPSFVWRIIGWRGSSLKSDLALDALGQAVCERLEDAEAEGLVHHSDFGIRYLSISYMERLAEAGIESSVGSLGDSYDNALAETIIGLFEAKVIEMRGRWRTRRTQLLLGPLNRCHRWSVSPELRRASHR